MLEEQARFEEQRQLLLQLQMQHGQAPHPFDQGNTW